MKKGYTKKVLEAQIRKYERALKLSDKEFDHWIINSFGGIHNCPVCRYRHEELPAETACYTKYHKEDCPAVDKKGSRCNSQKFFNVLMDYEYRVKKPTIATCRKTLKTRLKYWQRIYKEKYPEGLK